MKLKYPKLILSSFLAGCLIGLGGFAYLLAGPLLGAFLFPIGLYLICRLQVHLYTGKIGFVLTDKTYNWFDLAIICLSNLIGAALIGLFYHYTDNIVPPPKDLIDLSRASSIILIFVKAILCGALVHIAVDLYKKSAGEFEKFLSVLLPIALFVICGFRHCIADAFYYLARFEFSWRVPVTLLLVILGNSLGALGIAAFNRIKLV